MNPKRMLQEAMTQAAREALPQLVGPAIERATAAMSQTMQEAAQAALLFAERARKALLELGQLEVQMQGALAEIRAQATVAVLRIEEARDQALEAIKAARGEP